MVTPIKNKVSFYVAISLVFLIAILQFKSFDIKNNPNPYPISWDVYGYYLYLPATFIHNDLGLEDNKWINETRDKYNPSSTFYQVASGKDNKKIIIYNIGYSFIFAPGFLIANWAASPFGFEQDGFSKPYQLALIFTAFLFTLLGVIMFRKIALNYFSDKVTAILMIIVLVGTNYFFQATFDGIMPHNFLFTINCLILWFTIKWHKDRTLKNILLLAFFVGFATLCRPTELLWILIPLFWNVTNKELLIEKITYLFKNYIQLILISILVFCILSIQLLYNKFASGNFFEINLHSEGFSFLDPYTIDFLFSYKKGWLLYTPIMIFGIIGFYYLKKQNNKIWLALLLYFIFNIYVSSSWECWWYATSFSQRPMVESYAIMLFPMGYFIVGLKQQKKVVLYMVSFFILLLIILNLFQTWQFKKGLIDGERMTKEYYWKIFGKTKIDDEAKQFLSVDRQQNTFSELADYRNNYYKKEVFYLDFDKEENNTTDTMAVEGKSFILDQNTSFSPSFEQKYFDVTNKEYVWVRASVWVYLTTPYVESNSCIVISTESKGKSYKYLSSNYDNFDVKLNTWTEIHLDYLTPYIRHENDKLKVYFWNMGASPVLIDNFKVEVYEPKI